MATGENKIVYYHPSQSGVPGLIFTEAGGSALCYITISGPGRGKDRSMWGQPGLDGVEMNRLGKRIRPWTATVYIKAATEALVLAEREKIRACDDDRVGNLFCDWRDAGGETFNDAVMTIVREGKRAGSAATGYYQEFDLIFESLGP